MRFRLLAPRCGRSPVADKCLCYTFTMLPSEHWQKWAQTLQRNHLTGFAITLLEGTAPVRMLLSQVLLGIGPLFDLTQRDSFLALVETLDDPEECERLASFLKDGGTDERS